MKTNPQLISLGESIHDAIKKFGAVRRTHDTYDPPARVSPNLCGGCVAAAYFLAEEATKRGIPCEMIVGEEHAFTIHDGLIYDPTYVQFELPPYQEPGINNPKVQVWKPGEIPSHVWYKYQSSLKTTQESVDYIKRYYPVSSVDGYQLDWISPTEAHISWSNDRHTINPLPPIH